MDADENSKFSKEMRRRDSEETSLHDQIDELNQALTAANQKYYTAQRERDRAIREEKEINDHYIEAEMGGWRQLGEINEKKDIIVPDQQAHR